MKTCSPFKIRLCCAAVVFALAARALCDTTNLSPVADADVHLFIPDSNFGTAVSVVSGKLKNGEFRRALFRFDLSGIPAQASLTSASLRLTVTMVPNRGGAPMSIFDLRRVLKDWNESNVTWNNRVAPQTPWEVPGVGGSTDAAAASSSVLVGELGNYIFPATSTLVGDLELWRTNPGANFGWLLISEDEVTPQTARHFAAREDAANAPLLTVNYTLPSPPANPSLTNLGLTGTQFFFSFNAASNHIYTVESLTSLSSSNWATVTNFPSTNISLIRSVTNSVTSSNSFFRVRTF